MLAGYTANKNPSAPHSLTRLLLLLALLVSCSSASTPLDTTIPYPTQIPQPTSTAAAPTPTFASNPVPIAIPTATYEPQQPSLPTLTLPDMSDETRIIIAEGSIARYIVTEQLARFDIPNDAIGSTNNIEGFLRFNENGTIDEDTSKFRVDLRTLKSDKARRDAYLRNNTYESARFPFAEFAILGAPGLQWPLPTEGEATFQLVGDMTIHGVTAPLTWNVDASFKAEGAESQATTNFRFDTFSMEIPRLLFILSVEDNIQLELDLILNIVHTH